MHAEAFGNLNLELGKKRVIWGKKLGSCITKNKYNLANKKSQVIKGWLRLSSTCCWFYSKNRELIFSFSVDVQ